LFLGMLASGVLAGGIRLDKERAGRSLAPLGESLGLSVEEVARGIVTIITANMADAIREITIEQGQDPRQATLVPFGGAGPLFATLLARELEIHSIAIPRYAGNFSAWGLLGADVTRTAARTNIMRLTDASIALANDLLRGLFAGLADRTAGADPMDGSREIALDIRYAGQEHTLTIAVASTPDGQIAVGAATILESFRREYARAFGHTIEEAVEIVSLRATARWPLPRRTASAAAPAAALSTEPATHHAYSFTRDRWVSFAVLQRAALAVGSRVVGPAIILEETATTYLDAGFVAQVHPSGCLMLTPDVESTDAR
jgi:N-methylhydantoinase A